jgi:hypothetical protein
MKDVDLINAPEIIYLQLISVTVTLEISWPGPARYRQRVWVDLFDQSPIERQSSRLCCLLLGKLILGGIADAYL